MIRTANSAAMHPYTRPRIKTEIVTCPLLNKDDKPISNNHAHITTINHKSSTECGLRRHNTGKGHETQDPNRGHHAYL